MRPRPVTQPVLRAGVHGATALTLHLAAQHVLSRAQNVPLPHLCNMLLAFARLNFRPEQEDPFFSLVPSPLPDPVPCSVPVGGTRSQEPWVQRQK